MLNHCYLSFSTREENSTSMRLILVFYLSVAVLWRPASTGSLQLCKQHIVGILIVAVVRYRAQFILLEELHCFIGNPIPDEL